MTHPPYTAFTAYGVPMHQFALYTPEDVTRWVKHHARYWPGATIRRRTGCCWRVVWRESEREAA